MKVLAIEYSSAQRSIAIVQASSLKEPFRETEVIETGGRAANTFRMIDDALGQANLEREQIERIAVGLGPGSYTGIRAAISTAQGWQLARGTPLLGISSAEAILAEAMSLGLEGRVAVVIDAQRGEFYVSEFSLPGGKCEKPLCIAPLQEVLRLEQEGTLLIGPDVPPGAKTFKTVYPRAAVVAKLALTRTDLIRGEEMSPIYLRETTFVKAAQFTH
jgi:tRNA threonylcarbamoyl adenosine modification protein YeaZ